MEWREMADQDRQDYQQRLRGRNLATLFALLGFVALIYLVAIVRMAGA
jgi:uncharacterized protein YhdP